MLANLRKQIDRKKAELFHARRQVEEETESLKSALDHLQSVQAAQALVQQVARDIQASAHRQITSIVNRCLGAVFGDIYEFTIDFRQSRGKTEAHLLLVPRVEGVDGSGDDSLAGAGLCPLDSCGGGVADVLGFALRLAALMLSTPPRRRLLVLDEPFRHLSSSYRPRVRAMLEALSREFGVQMIVVTHAAELACGRVIEIS